jgi:pilus assembly protein CpaB
MKRRNLLVASALLLALLGTVGVYRYAKTADTRAGAKAKTTSVVVATKRVAAGTTWADTVKGGYLKQETMPADSVPSSAVPSTVNAAINKDAVAQAEIAPGQIVLREVYGTTSAQTGVLAIPKGLIAVSFSFAANADVAGFVAPGSQVVIFLSSKLNTKDPKLALSTGADLTVIKTLIPRVGVLAASQAAPTQVTGAADANAAAVGGSVLLTLALSQADAERVILGQKIGELYLGLLSASSSVTPNDRGTINAGAVVPVPIFLK